MKYPVCNITICDEIVRDYLPYIRAELVCRLVHDRGIPQVKVAKWMGISRSAVSQYLNKKRGCRDVKMSEELDRIIDSWADGVISGEGAVTICDICRCVYMMKENSGFFIESGNKAESK
ncbi:transcriptional regulator [Methanoplanus endosymbiosus]|uniref:Transcriptional regulator n=1 Tax=Methanoplanus endosymbiosus TaxID=33865 RepID=A0A9E7PPA9_9EURY|nr:transcriptional regulator [Methanoplanus endosymbiosus]UUX92376.1 transcriptional regulator [Methanoplanus endosymbiosus]